jgi:hexosaminidase
MCLFLCADEVDTSCWSKTPSVVAWMEAHNLTTDSTYEWFVTQVDAMALAINKKPMRWEEVWNHFGTDLNPQTLIHVWLNAETMNNASSHGYQTVYSLTNTYYLPHTQLTWQEFYNVDILATVKNESAKQLVLGGQPCMWGEWVDTGDLLQTIWPRAAAAAERLWSYVVVSNSSAAGVQQRLANFRVLLTQRGIPAAPLYNTEARTAPPGPGSVLLQ